jgi:hypothetical protein
VKHQRENPFLPKEMIPDENGNLIVFYFNAVDEWLEEFNFDGKFNTNFYDSLKEQFDEWGRLTPKQLGALENIYNRWVNK